MFFGILNIFGECKGVYLSILYCLSMRFRSKNLPTFRIYNLCKHYLCEGCEIGFRLPTLVQDFEANSISPYDSRRVPGTSGFNSKYTDLIYEDPVQYQNDQW